MKILFYTDNHFCERYSVIDRQGKKYTLRLENQLESINWVEKLAQEKCCQYIICAGDFFDKADLTQQELTALNDINWAPCVHYFLVGNHESKENDLHYNSTKALEGLNRFIISEPKIFKEEGFELAFLPYIIETDRKPAADYFPALTDTPRILISHNDLMGIQMGPVVSKSGFTPKELEDICTCCINGHLHNGQKITPRVLNLGNLTGKDFGEDASRYPHRVLIIDTDTMQTEFVENPYAFNFYRLEINNSAQIKALNSLKNNAVLSIKCKDTLVAELKAELEKLTTAKKVISSRIITIRDLASTETTLNAADLSMDHLAKFWEICREKFENTKILEEELAEILK